jgi:hypothetical protein
LCENYGPHKKYYPYITSEELLDRPLVTADDDILYPSTWLKDLADAYNRFPEAVNCFRARVISLTDDGIAKFSNWKNCTSSQASVRHLAIGDSGIIYPPGLLLAVRDSGTDFQKCCPKADDLWLHWHALRAGFKVRQIGPTARTFRVIPGSQKVALWNQNEGEGNDRQMRATYNEADIRALRQSSLLR